MSANNHTDEVIVNGVSSLEEPSVQWGWHGNNVKAAQIAGWASVTFLLLMVFGNHVGNQENWWLLAIAGMLAIALVGQIFNRKAGDRLAQRSRVIELPADHYALSARARRQEKQHLTTASEG